MAGSRRFSLITAIAYANSRPGLHTLYEVVGADAIARSHRMRGEDTYFLTGADQYSMNIATTAAKLGMTPRAFVDDMVGLFVAAELGLGIARRGSRICAATSRSAEPRASRSSCTVDPSRAGATPRRCCWRSSRTSLSETRPARQRLMAVLPRSCTRTQPGRLREGHARSRAGDQFLGPGVALW